VKYPERAEKMPTIEQINISLLLTKNEEEQENILRFS